MQKHAQFDAVENRSAGAAELSSTSSLAGRGIQKQRQGTEKLSAKMLNDPGSWWGERK